MRAGGQRFAETALLLGMTLQQASPLGIWSLAIPATGLDEGVPTKSLNEEVTRISRKWGHGKWGQFLILICKALKATLLVWPAS